MLPVTVTACIAFDLLCIPANMNSVPIDRDQSERSDATLVPLVAVFAHISPGPARHRDLPHGGAVGLRWIPEGPCLANECAGSCASGTDGCITLK